MPIAITERYLTFNFISLNGGRLGNQIFLVSSIFGAAKTLNRIPIVAYSTEDDHKTLIIFARLVSVSSYLIILSR